MVEEHDEVIEEIDLKDILDDFNEADSSINPPSVQHSMNRYQQSPNELEGEDEGRRLESVEAQKQSLEKVKSERAIKKPPVGKKKLKRIYSSKGF
jgi:hypothetical protein